MKKCKICDKKFKGDNRVSYCETCRTAKYEIPCKCGLTVRIVNVYTYDYFREHERCCVKCCRKYTGSLIGEKNGSFGKEWSTEKRKIQSELIKSKVNDEYREKCSKGKKGKSVSKETIEKKLKTEREKIENGYQRPPYTEEAIKNIGNGSSKKFTPEYKKYIRQIMEKNGAWIKLEEKDDYLLYKEFSNWKYQPITSMTEGVELLKIMNLYSKEFRNKNGLVRDHMFSRRKGFKDKIFPEILRHPANCQLISQLDNFNKGKSKSREDCVISLEQLFEKIESWPLEYYEQILCLSLIKMHKSGKRYEKEKYLEIKKLYL